MPGRYGQRRAAEVWFAIPEGDAARGGDWVQAGADRVRAGAFSMEPSADAGVAVDAGIECANPLDLQETKVIVLLWNVTYVPDRYRRYEGEVVPEPVAPQLVVNSRMIYFGWVPADPEAVAALVPDGLKPPANRQVFMNQYVVDRPEQTSGFGAYSLTYIGPDLEDAYAPDGETPGRWWTHYFNSSEVVRAYAAARGVPASVGRTTIEVADGRLVATIEADGVPVIRTTARVGETGAAVNRGQLRYITEVDGQRHSGIYPFVAEPVDPFEVVSLEFLEPSHSVYALRPADPLQIMWGFYSPRSSFTYPGGESVMT